jgi:hypothetical protein
VDLHDLDPRLLRLTYASRAADGLTRDDLRDIARTAQERNRKAGVTGLLLHVDGDFLQILEGPAATIERLYERIEADPRNRWVTRLATERVLRRAFEDWAMGCFDIDASQPSHEPFIALEADPPRLRPRFTGDFTVFLEQFYARNRLRGRAEEFASAI